MSTRDYKTRNFAKRKHTALFQQELKRAYEARWPSTQREFTAFTGIDARHLIVRGGTIETFSRALGALGCDVEFRVIHPDDPPYTTPEWQPVDTSNWSI